MYCRRRYTESNIAAVQGQKRQDPVEPGRQPQVRGNRRRVEQRDQQEKEMDNTYSHGPVRKINNCHRRRRY